MWISVLIIGLLLASLVTALKDDFPVEACTLPVGSQSMSEKYPNKVEFGDFEHVRLYDDIFYSKHCPMSSTQAFSDCTGPLSNIKIFTGLNIEESVEQSTMKFTVLGNPDKRNSSFISRFTGHLFAIPDAYVNMWGQTFDFRTRRRYLSGRCADLPDKPIYPISSTYLPQKTLEFNETVLNLVIPWSFVYGHELMEIVGILMILKPLLLTCRANIQLIGFHGLAHNKLFPLLIAAGIPPKSIIFTPIYQREQLVHAAWVIVPVFPCLYIPQDYVHRLRHALTQMPYQATNFPGAKNNIVLHDRRKQHPQRDVPEGRDIESALRFRYGGTDQTATSLEIANVRVYRSTAPPRQITVLYGSESLAETIQLMQQASVFFSVHSSATANMLFMRPNTTYVEVSPRHYDFDCMLGMAYALGMQAYDYEALSGHWQSSAHVNTTFLLPKLFAIIDAQDIRDGLVKGPLS